MQTNKSAVVRDDRNMYDLKAETALISSILSAEESNYSEVANEALAVLISTDFSPKYANVYRAIEIIKNTSNGIADYSSVEAIAKNIDANTIADLMECATTYSVKPMIDRILKVSRVRQLYNSAKRIEIITKSGTDIDKIINDAEAEFAKGFEITDRSDRGVMLADYLPDYVAEKQRQLKHGKMRGMKTGFAPLDELSGGFLEGDYIVVAGLPGMGKTSLVLSIVAEMTKNKKNGAIFSLEMGNIAIIDRLTCIYNEKVRKDRDYIITNYQHLKDMSKATKEDYGMYDNAWTLLRNSELYINDDPNITINKIRSICRRQNSKKKLDYVVIDHSLLLVQDRNSEREELSQMSAIIRKMSKELNTVVIFVSQLNYRDGKAIRPHKGMLKGSGSLSEDADMIIFPWRPFEVKKVGNPEDACLVLGKARAFESKDIPIQFCPISTGFYDLSEQEYIEKSKNTSFYFEEHTQKQEEEKPKQIKKWD